MALKKKGQVMLVSLMIGVLIFMAGMIMIDPLKDVITEVRGSSQLDCLNATISDGNKMSCLAVDLSLPYFIIVILGLVGAVVSAKLIGG